MTVIVLVAVASPSLRTVSALTRETEMVMATGMVTGMVTGMAMATALARRTARTKQHRFATKPRVSALLVAP